MLAKRTAVLIGLCALGVAALVVETLRGGDPSRGFIWALLVWVVLLGALTLGSMRKKAIGGKEARR